MPILAALLGSLFTSVTSFLVRVLAARVGFRLFILGSFVALSAAMVAFFNAAIAPLAANAFNTQYGQFIGLAFPPVAGSCMATILGAIVFAVAYKLKRQFLNASKGA